MYVGQKLSITAERVETEFAGKPIDFMQYHLDPLDPLYQEIKSSHPVVRFKWPGKLNRSDIRPERLNVKVNEEGLITEVYYG